MRRFVRLALDETAPDHSTISRTRRRIDVETHRAVFTWGQQRLVEAGLLKGKTLAIDATTLEANAATRAIVQRTRRKPIRGYEESTGMRWWVAAVTLLRTFSPKQRSTP